MEINTEKLIQEIEIAFKGMRFHPNFEEETFAIFEANGIQVQVRITKDTDEFMDEVLPGIVSV